MSVAEKKDDSADAQESPSMEEILKSIRGVISGDEDAAVNSVGAVDDTDGDDDELLELTEELTEMAEEEVPMGGGADSASTGGGAVDVAAPAEVAEKSVLDDIDDALSEPEPEPEPESAPEVKAEPVPEPVVAVPAAEPSEGSVMSSSDDVLEATKEEIKSEAVEALAADEGEVKTASLKSGERLLQEKVADESSETLRALVSNIPRTHVSSPYTKGGITLEELTIEAMKPFLADWLNQNLPTIVKQIVSKEIKKLIPEEEDK